MQIADINLGGPPETVWIADRFIFNDSMTAIAIAGTSEGFVIAADGRMMLENEAQRLKAPAATLAMENEAAQKIFPIRSLHAEQAYAITGFVQQGNFAVMEEIKRKMAWLAHRSFDTAKEYLEVVAEKVTDEMNEAKQDGRISSFPCYGRSANGNAWTLMTLIVAGYFRNAPALTIAEFTHTEGKGAACDVNSTNPVTQILAGSELVRRAMYPNPGDVPDPRFADYVQQLPLRSLIDAERLAKGFILACCSKLAGELDPESGRITGGKIHLAKITPESGFGWIIPPYDRSTEHA